VYLEATGGDLSARHDNSMQRFVSISRMSSLVTLSDAKGSSLSSLKRDSVRAAAAAAAPPSECVAVRWC
jgi:hypothetical protein